MAVQVYLELSIKLERELEREIEREPLDILDKTAR